MSIANILNSRDDAGLTPCGASFLKDIVASERLIPVLSAIMQTLADDIGSDATELTYMLLHRILQEKGMVPFRVPSSFISRAAMEHNIETCCVDFGVPPAVLELMLRQFFGVNLYDRLMEKHKDCVSSLVLVARDCLIRRQFFRDRLKDILRAVLQTPERTLASAFTQEGMRTLRKMPEITDAEWENLMIAMRERQLADATPDDDPKEVAQLKADTERRKKLRDHRLLEEWGDPPIKRLLIDRINCAKLREDLKRVRKTESTTAIAVQQRITADTVFRETLRFHNEFITPHKLKQTDARYNFPINVLQN